MAVTWFIVDRVGLSLNALGSLPAEAWIPRFVPFVGATALLLAAYFGSGSIWGVMVRDLGGPKLPPFVAVRLFMIANLGRYIPGKVWQLAGLAMLAKGRGVPAATATGSAVLGHGLALVVVSGLGMGALLTGPDPYPTWGLIGSVGIGIVIVFLLIPRAFARIAGFWFEVTRTEAPPNLGSLHGFKWLALLTANWLMYVVAFWLLTRSLGSQGALIPVASAYAAAYVLGYLMVFAPAGLGPREGFLILFLTPHVGATASGVIAVVARLWITLVELVPAGLFWTHFVARRKETDALEGGA